MTENTRLVIELVISVILGFIASSGFWGFLMHKMDKREKEDAKLKMMEEMLIGLGHDRVMYLGTSFIDRGYITSDEYENLHDYLYTPYEKMGGNGSAKHIMDKVDKLPIYKSKYSQ